MGFWERICKIQKAQTAKGIKTYGQRLEDNTEPDVLSRLDYLEEELVDALMYCEWIRAKLEGREVVQE